MRDMRRLIKKCFKQPGAVLPAVLSFEVLREVDGADWVFQVDVLGQVKDHVVYVRVVVLKDDGWVLQAGFFPAKDEAVLVLRDLVVGHGIYAIMTRNSIRLERLQEDAYEVFTGSIAQGACWETDWKNLAVYSRRRSWRLVLGKVYGLLFEGGL